MAWIGGGRVGRRGRRAQGLAIGGRERRADVGQCVRDARRLRGERLRLDLHDRQAGVERLRAQHGGAYEDAQRDGDADAHRPRSYARSGRARG